MPFLETLALDSQYALRTLRYSWGLSAVAILSLALGIGSAIAGFSVTNALMLKPLPVREPNRLMEVARSDTPNAHTTAIWRQIRSQQDVLSTVFAYSAGAFDLVAGAEKRRVWGLFVSGDYFQTLGVSAVLGRPLEDSDDQRGSPPVCVISYGLWQRNYGGSPAAIGSQFELDGVPFEVVGVAPRGFFGVDVGESFDVIVPLEAERLIHPRRPKLDDSRAWWLSVVGRLRPGISEAQSDARLRVLGPAIFRASLPPGADERDWQSLLHLTLMARPMANGISWARYVYGKAVLLLLAMVGAVLLISCANLANLLLARAAERQREISIRLALGAGRWRIVRQLVTESAFLCALGAGLSLLFARWAGETMVSLVSSQESPVSLELSWDLRVVAFSLLVSALCVLLVGLAPALRATRFPLESSLRGSAVARSTTRPFSGTSLIVIQVGLSTVLLICAGLLARNLQGLLAKDLGYEPKGVLLVSASSETGGENPQRKAFLGDELLRAFRSLPGIVSAARSTRGDSEEQSVAIARLPDGSEHRVRIFTIFVSPEHFRTQQTSFPAGRDFGPQDSGASTPVAILSESAARSLFPGVNPLGLALRQLDPRSGFQQSSLAIVGIAQDVQYRRPYDAPLPVVYRPISQCPESCALPGTFELRFTGPLSEIRERVKSAALNLDAHVALGFGLMSDGVNEVIQRERVTAGLSMMFSLLTLALAVIGIYGITSHTSSQRTFEIGVRRALGAQPENVRRMIVGETIGRVAAGVVLGSAAGFGAARAIQSMLFGVAPGDPLAFTFAAGLMLLVAAMASFFPAYRASKVDPITALRAE